MGSSGIGLSVGWTEATETTGGGGSRGTPDATMLDFPGRIGARCNVPRERPRCPFPDTGALHARRRSTPARCTTPTINVQHVGGACQGEFSNVASTQHLCFRGGFRGVQDWNTLVLRAWARKRGPARPGRCVRRRGPVFVIRETNTGQGKGAGPDRPSRSRRPAGPAKRKAVHLLCLRTAGALIGNSRNSATSLPSRPVTGVPPGL